MKVAMLVAMMVMEALVTNVEEVKTGDNIRAAIMVVR